MEAQSPARVVYSFGPFRIDAEDRVLWRDRDEVSLTLKAAETLLVLLENAGHVVEKEALLSRVWPDTFVEESTLAQNILTLRKALGKQTSGQEYIGTVPRRGYRFESAVTRDDQKPAVTSVAPPPQNSPNAKWRVKVLAGVTALAAFAAIAFLALRLREKSVLKPAETRVRLAVLPLASLNGDSSQEYLNEGLTEELITQLGSLNPDHLSVIARASAMAYRNTSKDARQIGRELNVDFLLGGSVRRENNRVRVSVQLIRVADESNLWTANYDRELRNILELENDVARSVASQIALRLTPEETARLGESRPLDPLAYEDYLKARHFWNRRTPETLDKAIRLLQQATDRDPSYARSHAALADCYAIVHIYHYSDSARGSLKLAEEEAKRAIELDPTLAEPHATLAYAFFYEWKFPAAEAEFQNSIRQNARYATAHQWYAEYLRFLNRQEEAIAESNRALEIDPLSPIINVEAALPYYYRGEYEKAAAQLRRTIDLDPYFASAHGHLCRVYDAQGKYSEALQECLAAKALGNADWVQEDLAVLYVHSGEIEKARTILRTLPDPKVYLALGDKERAYILLEQALAKHEPSSVGLKVEPRLAALRGEPRFQAVLRRIGLVN